MAQSGSSQSTKSRRREAGATIAEFALVLPVLLLLVFGIIECGRAFNAKLTISHAAREGARELAVTGDSASATTVAQNASAPLLTPADLTITTSGCTPGDPVQVTVDYTFRFLVPLIGTAPIPMSSTGAVLCEL